MKDRSGNYNIADRLATRKRKKATVTMSPEAVAPPMPSSPRMVMTVEEMGKELGISRATAYELSQHPDFPSFTIGRRVLVSRDGLARWIEKQYTEKQLDSSETIEK
ncbi:MAG: helix-turn-helix domain-containing protein [Clostridia bacterium]|nr:helix-turn-helix domain-containing protein [Clostridia bacterium]